VKSHLWRAWYGLFAWQTSRRAASFRCMNWGWHDPTEEPIDDEERYPLQLYRRVVAGVDLNGKHVAEVSCGRGGGLAWLHRTCAPAQATGIDFTPANVRMSQESFGEIPDLRFQVGRAEELPFADDSIDVVVSVEASHCYQGVDRFLAECARVLRRGVGSHQ